LPAGREPRGIRAAHPAGEPAPGDLYVPDVCWLNHRDAKPQNPGSPGIRLRVVLWAVVQLLWEQTTRAG